MLHETTTQRFRTAVLARLRSLGWRLRLYVLLDGLAMVSVAVLVSVVITLVIDRSLRLEWDMRFAQLASLLLALAIVIWWVVVRPLRVPVRVEHLAVLIERRFPQLASRLISAVEFVESHKSGATAGRSSPVLVEAVVREAAEQAGGLTFRDVLEHRRACRRAGIVSGCVLVLLVMSLTARETMGLWLRRNVLLEEVPWPQRNQLVVEGLTEGRIIVPRGEDVTLSAVVAEGYRPPRQVFIVYEGDSGRRGREQMPAVSQQAVRFTHTFEQMDESLRCRVVGGDAETEWFRIEVVDRPRIDEAVLEIVPPAYTQIPAFELRAGQTVAEVLKGSEVRFRIRTNKPVVQAALMRQDQEQVAEVAEALPAEDGALAVADRPAASSTYHFRMIDDLGLSNLSERVPPVRFSIRLMADKAPKVNMRLRNVGDMITTDAILPIETDFSDQYGLATAAMVYQVSHEGAEPVSEPVEGFEAGTKAFTRVLEWPVSGRGLTEGDRLSIHAEATDFDDVSGPNVGTSTMATLRVVSRNELLAELSRREQEHRRDFERLVRQQEDLYAELLAAIEAAGPVDAAASDRPFAQVARRQRDYAGRLNLLRVQFEQVLWELRINQLSTPAVEARLGQNVVEPMDSLHRVLMPLAADRIDRLDRERSADAIGPAREGQEAVLAEMKRILESLLKWEGYQEAVTLLREVLKMQKSVSEETEKRIEQDIFGVPPGTGPAPR